MGSSFSPSLLEYARFYGIASDFTAIDPVAYIDDSQKTPPSEPRAKPVIEQLRKTHQPITQSLLKEKLNIKKEGAHLLSTVIRDAGAKAEDFNWGDILPAFDRTGRLQLDTPIFPAEHDTNTLLAQGQLRYEEREIQLEPLQEPASDETLRSPLADSINEAMGNIKSEKLSCSKDAFLLIQRSKDCARPSKEALADLLVDELRPCQDGLVFPEPPRLVLSDVDESYIRSLSPVTRLQVLPSPISPYLISKRSARTGTSLPHRKHGQSKDAYIDSEPCIFNGYHRERPGCVESGDELNEASECNSLHKISSSGQGSIDGSNHDSYAQNFPDVPTHTENPLPSFNRSILDINSQSHASVNCLSVTDSPPKSSISKPQIDAIISSTDASTPSNAKRPVSARKDVCSNATRSIFSGENGKHEMSQECTSHSTPEDLSKCRSDIVPAKLPLQAIYKLNDQEQSLEEQTQSHPENKPSKRLCRRLKYRGILKHKSLPPQKRKRSKTQENMQVKQKGTHQTKKFQREETPDSKVSLPSQASLGSLSTFMEIRGRIKPRRPFVATSQYFTESQPIDNVEHHDSITNTEEPNMHIPGAFIDRVPQIQHKIDGQSYLFVSTALLKTHLSLVKCIEKTPRAPTIIYRDYDTTTGQFQSDHSPTQIPSQPDTRHTLPKEADIIISPSTGVFLTTSQTITHLYLPGHKPKNPKISGLKCVNSPLREQIFLLTSRYERLYLLISHATSSTKGPQEGSKCLTWTVDKRTLSSFNSLLAFCDSLSDCTNIIPLWVPSSPEKIAKWILSLHDKHAVDLPYVDIGRPQAGFTPVNPSPKPRVTGSEEHVMVETVWEHFLRRAGLNPYAAQAVLLILNKEGVAMKSQNDGSTLGQGKIGALSVFMEISSERRLELFGKLLGEKMVGRVNLMIENDWQCAWALNLNDSA